MSDDLRDPSKPSFKQRASSELKDFSMIAAYLAVLFCAMVAYTNLVSRKYGVDPLNYTFAIVNALVIGKVILLGEMAHLGKRVEGHPLYQSVLLKSFLFGLLVFAFHIVEEFIKRLYHGKPAGTILHETDYEQLIARSIIIFCAFVPLFAFREFRRALGPEKFDTLFFHGDSHAD